MQKEYITSVLAANRDVFRSILGGIKHPEITWRPAPGKWCLLEVVCHLYDEERLDFRFRMQHVMEKPGAALPPIDPTGWVTLHDYMSQEYQRMLDKFLEERDRSIGMLQQLTNPDWSGHWEHPKYGKWTAGMFFANWLAHDYLHIRQIMKIRHQYLAHLSGQNLLYAGEMV